MNHQMNPVRAALLDQVTQIAREAGLPDSFIEKGVRRVRQLPLPELIKRKVKLEEELSSF